MTFALYLSVISLDEIFVHLLKGTKCFFLLCLFLLFFVRLLLLEYSLSEKSDEDGRDKSDKLGYTSGPAGTFDTGLSRSLRGAGLPLGVTLSVDESCDGDGGSLFP